MEQIYDGLFTINQLFTNRIFRIPDYQRGYSWREEQVKALWEDILNISDNGVHYTGMITAQKPSKRDVVKWSFEFNLPITVVELTEIFDMKPLYIADGQQRLTTIILLLTAIRDSVNFNRSNLLEEKYIGIEIENLKVYHFGYEIDMPSYSYLKNKIFTEGICEEKETNYTKNLREAKKFFDDVLHDLSSEKINSIFETVTSRLLFNYYEIPEGLDIFTIFETMNYRGKPLTTLELLKNRLIYLIANTSDVETDYKDALRYKVNECWTNIYQNLAKNKLSILNDDEYLRIHWFMYFNHRKKKGKDLIRYKQNLLDEFFTKQNLIEGNLSLEIIQDYIESLSNSSSFYFSMKYPNYELAELSIKCRFWLTKINRMYPKSYFEPLILAAMVKRISDEQMVELLKNIERYIFLFFGLAEFRSNTNKVPFLIEANKVYSGIKDIKDVIKKMKPEDIKTGDREILAGEVKVNMESIETIIDHFKKNREKTKSDEGFRNWKFIRYFMVEYEEYLENQNNHHSYLIKDNPGLELVFPPKREIPKRDEEKKNTNTKFNSERKINWEVCINGFSEDGGQQYLAYTLGNIILVNRTERDNSKSFTERKKDYDYTSFSEEEVYGNIESWTPMEILSRGIKLLDFLEERWDIAIDFNFKKDILYLNRLNISEEKVKQKEKYELDLFSRIDDVVINILTDLDNIVEDVEEDELSEEYNYATS